MTENDKELRIKELEKELRHTQELLKTCQKQNQDSIFQSNISTKDEQLKESARLLNASQKLSKAGGWEWDVIRQTMKWTDQTYLLHDMNRSDFTEGSAIHIEKGKNCYAPDDRIKISEAFARCIDYGESYDMELPFTTEKGRKIWIRTTAEVEMSQGKVSKVMGIIIDITERKKLEIALRESELRFRELFQNMSSSVAVYKAVENGNDFVFVDFNKSAEKLDKLSKDNVIGKKVTELYPGVDTMEIFEVFKRVWKTGISEKSSIFEYKNNRISGWRENFVYKLPTGEIVAIYDDITERKRVEEQLSQSRKMEAIGQLAGGIAHNFNNALCGIMNATQLLQLPARNLDDKGRKYTGMIMQASETASDLVSKLLSFGRKKAISVGSQNLETILNETVDILSGTLDKKTSVSLILNAKDTQILGEYAGLENVFLNLCLNANQAMEEGGEILIKTENSILDKAYCDSSAFDINPGKFCKITISDSGSGISPEDLDKIFDPFFTTREQGKGLGLGLSAVYGVIQDHKGEILVESTHGEGTSFFILIPCVQEKGSANFVESSTYSDFGTILFVDDEEMNRILGAEILESLGYKTMIAENGRTAIELFRNKHEDIDIVIMDMVMPEMDGSEAFKKMQEIDMNCKVIIASGHSEDGEIEDMKKSGLRGFLQKPYKVSDISRILKDM